MPKGKGSYSFRNPDAKEIDSKFKSSSKGKKAPKSLKGKDMKSSHKKKY